MGINDWSEQERPRERLVREGAAALSNSELLALLLRVGVRGKSAVELGRDILEHFGSLHGLFGATLSDISRVQGLGDALGHLAAPDRTEVLDLLLQLLHPLRCKEDFLVRPDVFHGSGTVVARLVDSKHVFHHAS